MFSESGVHALIHQEATVQLASKFTARIGKNAYLARIFARHVRLLAFDARVSKSLAQETMLASYAARDLYVLTHNPHEIVFPCTKICSRVISRNSYLHTYHYYASEFTLAVTFSITFFVHGSLHN